ncbi:hypothetical protein TeGR_g10810 [Tetraparma gracilis]|uniref:Uncharacterized protein n=1 Tax=Tetraparma gracilis TaxID=2962635 RepID=A0ABQ6MM13_9STRA|nr:hypothetical protein TeGR_g10810 [Tetraparma gracilis]
MVSDDPFDDPFDGLSAFSSLSASLPPYSPSLPPYSPSLPPATLQAASSVLLACGRLSVARSFASSIISSGALPALLSYVPPSLPPDPDPLAVDLIERAVGAVRNLACAHREVRDLSCAAGAADRILALLAASLRLLQARGAGGEGWGAEGDLERVACAALGALRNVTLSNGELVTRLRPLGLIPALHLALAGPGLWRGREPGFRACGALMNSLEACPAAAKEFVAADCRCGLKGFAKASDLAVGDLDRFNPKKPLHAGYLALLAAVVEAVGRGEVGAGGDAGRLIGLAVEAREKDFAFRERRKRAGKKKKAGPAEAAATIENMTG